MGELWAFPNLSITEKIASIFALTVFIAAYINVYLWWIVKNKDREDFLDTMPEWHISHKKGGVT